MLFISAMNDTEQPPKRSQVMVSEQRSKVACVD